MITVKLKKSVRRIDDRSIEDASIRRLKKTMNKYGFCFSERHKKILRGEIPFGRIRIQDLRALINRAIAFGDLEAEHIAEQLYDQKIQEMSADVEEPDDDIVEFKEDWLDELVDDILSGKDVDIDARIAENTNVQDEDDSDTSEEDSSESAEESTREFRIRSKEKPILQYGLDGTFVAYHASIKDAALKVNGTAAYLSKCRNENRPYKGYQWLLWSNLYGAEFPESIPPSHGDLKCVPVFQYNLAGTYVSAFPSIAAAARSIGVTSSKMQRIIERKCSYGGFYWSESKEDTFNGCDTNGIEDWKVRVFKFGLDQQFIAEYESVKEAASLNDLSTASITNSAKTGFPAKGFFWSYTREDNHFKDRNEPSYEFSGRSKKVYQFSPAGELLNIYNTAREAAYAAYVIPDRMYQIIKNKIMKNGSYWSYESEWKTKPIAAKKNIRQSKAVCCLDETGKVCKTFKSLSEAARALNITYHTVQKIIESGRSYKQYIWKYQEDME